MQLLSLEIQTLPQVIVAGQNTHSAGWVHHRRKIDEYALYFIHSGKMYIKEGETEYLLKKNDVMILEPGIEHYGYKPSSCSCFYIHFMHPNLSHIDKNEYDKAYGKIANYRQMLLKSDDENLHHYTCPCYFPKHYHMSSSSGIFEEVATTCDEFNRRLDNFILFCSLKTAEILLKISREYISSTVELKKVDYLKSISKVSNLHDYLNTAFGEKITSTDLEKRFDTNFDYINRRFQSTYGWTIFKYITKLRITKAKELMQTTDLNFSEISYHIGISDPYYFSKLFKKYTGISPTEYLIVSNRQWSETIKVQREYEPKSDEIVEEQTGVLCENTTRDLKKKRSSSQTRLE